MSQNAKKKKSTVRHTRAIQRDRSKHPLTPPPAQAVADRLTELVLPAAKVVQAQAYHGLGLRLRSLSLVVMMAFVLSLIWRQVGSLNDGVRLLNHEGLLWVTAMTVSQQALSQRMGSLAAELFEQVLLVLLPLLHHRWQQRQRPLPPELAWAQTRYRQVLACDGSTLDALLRKTGLLRGLADRPLAGRMTALLDLCSRLPYWVFYEADPHAHDLRFGPRLLQVLQAGVLLIFDLGYTDFKLFHHLTLKQIKFITRAKRNLAYQVERYLHRSANVHDLLIWVGSGTERQQLRLVLVWYRGRCYRYLTNELDAQQLPPEYLVALYWQRWRIEDAYALVKRLLGLAYFWTGGENGVCLQLWTTWMLYAILVDLTDAVAQTLNQPLAALSLEMVYRALYFFAQAAQRGEGSDLVAYLAANAQWLGILKTPRKRKQLSFELVKNLTNPAPA